MTFLEPGGGTDWRYFGQALGSTDINNDGYTELLIVGGSATYVAAFGATPAAPSISSFAALWEPSFVPYKAVGGDVTGDGYGDVVVRNAGGTISLYQGGPSAIGGRGTPGQAQPLKSVEGRRGGGATVRRGLRPGLETGAAEDVPVLGGVGDDVGAAGPQDLVGGARKLSGQPAARQPFPRARIGMLNRMANDKFSRRRLAICSGLHKWNCVTTTILGGCAARQGNFRTRRSSARHGLL